MIEKDIIIGHVEKFLSNSDNYLVEVIVTPANSITVEIDNDSNVSVDDCVALSKFIESQIDRESEDFELTVTSAGISAPFKNQRQYNKYQGKEVEVLTKKGEKLTGVLKESDANGFTLVITKKIKPEGAKKKIEITEEQMFNYGDIKHTKYLIRFK